MSVKSTTGRIVLLGVTALTGAVLFAGCGGSDSDSNSKEDFIASADQICAEFRDQSKPMEQEFQDAISSGDLDSAATVFEDQADGMSQAVDDMEALDVPDGDEETISQFIDLSRQQVDVTREAAEAIRNGDKQALNAAITKGDGLDAQSDQIADEYGLTDCGSAGDSDSSAGS